MAQNHYKRLLRKVLLGFITEQDPVLAMLEWVAQMMMQIEAESRVGAEKGKHTKDRKTYFSGARVRRGDVIPVHSQSPQGRLYPVFYHRAQALGAGPDDACPGSLHQWSHHSPDRATGQGHWNREHLGRPGLRDYQRTRRSSHSLPDTAS